MNKTAWLMLLSLSFAWGASFFFGGVTVKELPPLTIVFARLGLAALALYIIVIASGQRMPTQWRLWVAFGGMGAMNNALPFSLIVWGQTQIASGLAAILVATTPAFAVLVAHFLTADEKITRSRLFGVTTGFAGVAFMIGPAALAGLGETALAQLAVLGAACSYAFAAVFGLRFRQMGISPLITATGSVSASAVLLAPLMLLLEQPWNLPVPSATVWAALLGFALLSTVLAYVLYFRIISIAGATNVTLATFLVPVIAIMLGGLFLNETLEATHAGGLALIGLGLAAIDGRPLRWWKRR